MRKFVKLSALLLLVGTTAGMAIAQSPQTSAPVKHYKVDFVVKEVDANGRVVNSRSYSTILAANNQGSPNQIRSGDRVPILTSSKNDKEEIQYIDIGVNIDCRNVQDMEQKLAMTVKAEVSSVPDGTDLKALGDPIIRQFQWNSDIVVSVGVPTSIFSSDDVGSKSKIQIEVTPTLIK